jgi:hypothetical protein
MACNQRGNKQPTTCSVSPGFQEHRELSEGLLRRKTLGALLSLREIPRSGATWNFSRRLRRNAHGRCLRQNFKLGTFNFELWTFPVGMPHFELWTLNFKLPPLFINFPFYPVKFVKRIFHRDSTISLSLVSSTRFKNSMNKTIFA